MRRDATERREKLLDAAEMAFSNRGINVPLEEIAERAGVGAGTFYRNFRDRQALMDALLERSLDRMEQKMREVPLSEAPLYLIEYIADCLVEGPVLSEYWRTEGKNTDTANRGRERFMVIADRGMREAVASGLIRHDLSPADFPLISGMLGAIMSGRDRAERILIRERLLCLLYRGILSTDRLNP
ncbi:TetR/AcrR family transcriptional regulator [Pectobacterium polaris]|uniref:TetR/AcrR family transcriptional regulator n=1 Tax=Pectobacterium polaris TaxID=2042057 RepID=UPI002404965E|nr:TetR/AcrR family transcriptional regulator [Pectobacterium polaris]MDG0800216.1 TetR/AcrR family transcriptional regulator [Pectobacterium polaris]